MESEGSNKPDVVPFDDGIGEDDDTVELFENEDVKIIEIDVGSVYLKKEERSGKYNAHSRNKSVAEGHGGAFLSSVRGHVGLATSESQPFLGGASYSPSCCGHKSPPPKKQVLHPPPRPPTPLRLIIEEGTEVYRIQVAGRENFIILLEIVNRVSELYDMINRSDRSRDIASWLKNLHPPEKKD